MPLPSLRSLLLATLVLSAACGGGTPEPGTPSGAPSGAPSAATPADSSASAAPAGPSVWTDGMSRPQQVAFMKQNVVPRMSKAFQGHDAAKYTSFDCKTCHGPSLGMPKDFLPHLTFQGGKITSFADKPEMSKFMHEVVEPEMAAAMGQPVYDPATQKGFGCNGCHAVDMK
jgi:hypothetical protein